MKYFGFILAFLLAFSLVNGFCQGYDFDIDDELLDAIRKEIRDNVRAGMEEYYGQRDGEEIRGNLTLITSELVKNIQTSGADIRTLDFYLSNPLFLIKKPDSNYRINKGTLVFDEGNKIEIIHISATEKGKFLDYGVDSGGRDFFEVNFFDNLRLRFFKNFKNDYFILEQSVGFPSYYEGTLPSLGILLHKTGEDLTLNIRAGIPATTAPGTPVPRVPAPETPVPAIPTPGNPASKTPSPEIPATGINKLTENGRLEKETIVAFISSHNQVMPRVEIESIVSTYIQEAKAESINHDIAIAQMCYATNFLKAQQRLVTHNYAGLGDSKFDDRVTGIRAHIQHLKGYVSSERPKGTIVDPRYDVLVKNGILGTVSTLEGMYLVWAPQSYDYGDKIDKILNDLYQFQGR